MSKPNFHQSQGILHSFGAVIRLSLITELQLLDQASNSVDDVQDILLTKLTLLAVELRVAVNCHLHDLFFRNQHHLPFTCIFCQRSHLSSCCLCILSNLCCF